MSCTCMLGCRKILVKDEEFQMIKICNDATYKIKSWNYDTFIRYGGIILPPPYMQVILLFIMLTC